MIGIVDAQNLVFRYFFQPAEMGRLAGHAVKNIMELVFHYNLDGVIIVWDGGSKKRRELYSEYKSQRKGLDEKQLADYKTLCADFYNTFKFCGFVQCKVPDEEADDVIATLTKDLLCNDSIIICSNDKDFYGLLSDRVKIWNWKEERSPAWFKEEYGVFPEDWTKVRSLMGDASDNIKGVDGIGIKTALKILKEGKYGEFDNRDDVQLFKKILDFMFVEEGAIAKGMDVGKLDKFKFYQEMEACHLGVNLWENVIALSRKWKPRLWKTSLLQGEMAGCRNCSVYEHAQNLVTFRGMPSDILVVGDSPGEHDDREGIPFIGRDGAELNKWLGQIGLTDKVMISNTVWHRTLEDEEGICTNRVPTPKEIETCSKYGIIPLIERLVPKLIITLGSIASNCVMGNKINILKDCGKYRVDRFGFPVDVWVLPHPSSSIMFSSKIVSLVEAELPKIEQFVKEQGII